MPDYTNTQLIEKIVRAKMQLESTRVAHTCMIDMDPDYMGPCTCGASAHNSQVEAALRELKL